MTIGSAFYSAVGLNNSNTQIVDILNKACVGSIITIIK